MKCVRYLWASPATLVGLVLAALVVAARGRLDIVRGVLEVSGDGLRSLMDRLPRSCRFAAITFGHVVIALDERTHDVCRDHERVHVRQYERWGVLFFPLYLGSSLWQWARGRDAYRDNFFEREAFEKAP